MSNVISLKNISKVYGEGEGKTIALDNVNLEISKGEMIAIMGPSGSGKSTLLNILGCLDVQSSGQYFLEGKELNNLSDKELARIRNEKIGFIFQNFNLLNDRDLVYNVALPLNYSKNKGDIFRRARRMLTKVDLDDHINKTPDKLSGGQKQRVAIARALVNDPEIILADEPTGALDKKNGENIIDMLKEINELGKTVIIITHNEEIAKECKKQIKIVDGKLFEEK